MDRSRVGNEVPRLSIIDTKSTMQENGISCESAMRLASLLANISVAGCGGQYLRTVKRLTFVPPHTTSAPVIVSRKFLSALFALAVWLVATQHCNLEAAGILTPHASEGPEAGCCSGSNKDCSTDNCDVLEGGTYRNANESDLLSAPSFVCCHCFICLSVVFPPAEATIQVTSRTDFERPLDWVPTWQFLQRAALLPGAPSVNA
jgi:hypothetical protein